MECLNHMLPHVRASQARMGAALCKCLPASCWTAHVCVVVIPHGQMGGELSWTGPRAQSTYHPYLSVCLSICWFACMSNSSYQHLPIPYSMLLPHSPLAVRACSWDGEEEAGRKRGEGWRKVGKGGRTDQRCRLLFPADIVQIRSEPKKNNQWLKSSSFPHKNLNLALWKAPLSETCIPVQTPETSLKN